MYLLYGKNITCGYDTVDILSECTVGVKKGEIASIVGPNGAGKSTAMKSIFGLLKIRLGKIFLDNEDITNLLPQERVLKGMGYVPQTNNIFPTLSVQENLEMGAFIQHEDFSDILDYVYDLFPVLKEKRNQQAGELSGGQRQRVAIGRSIVRAPSAFLFDEPLSNLDAALRVEMRLEIAKLHKSLKSTMIYVTHDQTEAMTLADRIVVLDDGKIIQVGTPRELYQKPCKSIRCSIYWVTQNEYYK